MRWLNIFKEVCHVIRVSIYVPECAGCGEPLAFRDERSICRSCLAKIRPYYDPVCRLCGKSLEQSSGLCGECSIMPPPFLKHLSYCRYDGLFRELIVLFKFKRVEGLKDLFVDCLNELFEVRIHDSFDWLVPVPADPGRKREVNPILLMAKGLSRRLDIPLMSGNLIKVRRTDPQVLLSQARRLKNLNGAFVIKEPSILKDQRVLLLDDVYTTGTTIKKCAVSLKRAGAEVAAITLARSI